MIGRKPITELEGKKNLLYKELDRLDSSRTRIIKNIERAEEKIAYQEWRVNAPKVYYDHLDGYYTFEEIIEFEEFFNKEIPTFPTTELTSIC